MITLQQQLNHHNVAIVGISEAFIHADMDEEVIMQLAGDKVIYCSKMTELSTKAMY